MSESVTRTRQPEPAARVALAPLADTSTFAERAYVALKDVILSIDVYGGPGEVRLDERALAQDLGIRAPQFARPWLSWSAKVLCARCHGAAFTSCAKPNRK